jgi:hypothetical protein
LSAYWNSLKMSREKEAEVQWRYSRPAWPPVHWGGDVWLTALFVTNPQLTGTGSESPVPGQSAAVAIDAPAGIGPPHMAYIS